ncbi:MAG TPA: DUF4832 domain-containing protein [Bryobacteraceae bacterium]|nr:DUF4832 domain-containing protein [Bryobacteraceae bacterium]
MRAITLLACWAIAGLAQTVVVHPKRIDDVLVNPGMGIQTFQRFNGDALNSALKWSEEGPTGALAAAPDVKFPGSTIAYCRWFWETLEPEKGHVRWEIVDRALEQAHAHGQALAIRLMPYDQGHPLPEWYRKSGARRANPEGAKIWEPDFSDPLYLKYWGDLVRAAGQRYNGHPDLDTVDISSVGYWGEGWSDYMPAFPYQKKLIDIWFDAFPATPLLMNFDQPEALAYGTSRGAGWRMDCLGDLRPNWCHMLDFYPEQIARTGIQDVWKRSPVSFETCWVPGYWKQRGWDVRYILGEALRWHVTSLNIKSSAIPPEFEDAFQDFERRMGYRFELRRMEYPASVRTGDAMPVRMWWVNSGVAPVYRPYLLALAFQAADGQHEVVTLPEDLRKWLPGDMVVETPVAVPRLTPGTCRLRVGLLDPRTHQPAIKLGIEGRAADGWYDLGTVKVESALQPIAARPTPRVPAE